MNIWHTIVIKITHAITAVLVLVGIASPTTVPQTTTVDISTSTPTEVVSTTTADEVAVPAETPRITIILPEPTSTPGGIGGPAMPSQISVPVTIVQEQPAAPVDEGIFDAQRRVFVDIVQPLPGAITKRFSGNDQSLWAYDIPQPIVYTGQTLKLKLGYRCYHHATKNGGGGEDNPTCSDPRYQLPSSLSNGIKSVANMKLSIHRRFYAGDGVYNTETTEVTTDAQGIATITFGLKGAQGNQQISVFESSDVRPEIVFNIIEK